MQTPKLPQKRVFSFEDAVDASKENSQAPTGTTILKKSFQSRGNKHTHTPMTKFRHETKIGADFDLHTVASNHDVAAAVLPFKQSPRPAPAARLRPAPAIIMNLPQGPHIIGKLKNAKKCRQ